MKKHLALFLATLMASGGAFASTARILDGSAITNGSALLTLPTTTDTVVGRATTDTLLNKTLSGATNTFTLIPPSAITGLSGTNSGDVTLGTASGLSLSGQVLSLGVASAGVTGALTGSDWSLFNSKQPAGSYITALTGDLTLSGFSAGSATATLSTVNSNVGSFSNANITVDAKGRITAAANGVGNATTVVGSRAAPTSVTAVGGVAFTGTAYSNLSFIQGSGGAVVVTATPQIAAGTNVGQVLNIISRSATNTVTLADGTGLSLNGSWVGGLDSAIHLTWDGTSWVEISRR